ncbi:MAG TPA: hypothetical protein VFO16_09670 [Pseudonocardiaceae bacterium]|nr:hypothetical protein [Pseudonocardiaceae bacterium]
MAHPRPAVHRTILVVDVEGFGDRHRTNVRQVVVRTGLYRAVESAFGAAGISWGRCHHEDRGDGVFVLAPPEVPEGLFVGLLPCALVEALHEHNRAHRAEERIRLRAALHAGEIDYDGHGVTAAVITLAFRLVEAHPLKAALAESAGVLALIVSSWFFDEVVWHSTGSDPATYRRVWVTVKEIRTPGLDLPAGSPSPVPRSAGPAGRAWPIGAAAASGRNVTFRGAGG